MAESSNESASCEHVRLYSHNWQGAHLFTPCLICERDRLRAALERLRGNLLVGSELRQIADEALAGSPAETVAKPYYVRTFWSPDKRYLVTAHVYVPEGQDCSVIGMQDDDGVEWEPASEQKDMSNAQD